SLGAAVGLVSVVAAASNTSVAAILMGVELFGGVTGTVYVAGASIAAYLVIGHRSVYPDQVLAYSKSSWMQVRPDLPLGQEKVRLSYGLLKWISKYQLGRSLENIPSRERLKEEITCVRQMAQKLPWNVLCNSMHRRSSGRSLCPGSH